MGGGEKEAAQLRPGHDVFGGLALEHGCFMNMGMNRINTYRYIFSGMNIHESQLFWGSLGTRVLTHPHKIPAFLLGRLAINRYFSSGFTYIYMELSFNIGIWLI